jgi:hypothetical protein
MMNLAKTQVFLIKIVFLLQKLHQFCKNELKKPKHWIGKKGGKVGIYYQNIIKKNQYSMLGIYFNWNKHWNPSLKIK